MYDALNKHARSLAWSPDDDHSYLFEAQRLTSVPALVKFNMPWQRQQLPNGIEKWHLFSLGIISPKTLGLDMEFYSSLSWVSFDQLSIDQQTTIHTTVEELTLPNSECYFTMTVKGEAMVAVRYSSTRKFLKPTNATIRVKWFSNNWLAKAGRVTIPDFFDKGYIINDPLEANELLTDYAGLGYGNKQIYHNGYLVDDLKVSEVKPTDTLRLTLDPTGRGYYDVDINDLAHYMSDLDGITKYLVQIPATDKYRVFPVDELDLFIVGEDASGKTRGFSYQRYGIDDVRQLTHQAFGIDSERVSSLLAKYRKFYAFNNPKLRIYTRYNANDRLGFPGVDGSYLLDLYNADLTQRRQLMTGPSNFFEKWWPQNLEQSGLMNWTRISSRDLYKSPQLEGVLSPEEVNRFLLEGDRDTNLFEDNSQKYFYPGKASEIGGMILCFNEAGNKIQTLRLDATLVPQAVMVPDETDHCSFLPGNFVTFGTLFDRDLDFVSTPDEWACDYYYSTQENQQWVPASEGVDYHYVDGNLVWDDSHQYHERMQRSVKDSIYRNLEIETGMLYHPINIYTSLPPTLIRLGFLDIYLNDSHRLVEGVDFTVDYPYIKLNVREYTLGATENQKHKVEIFHYGIPSDTSKEKAYGFVRGDRILSETALLTKWRGMALFVDGLRKDETQWDAIDVEGDMSTNRSGGIFLKQPLPTMVSESMAKRLGLDYGNDVKAGQTLKPFLYRDPGTDPVYIEHDHAVFSPFMYRLIQMLRSGEIAVPTTPTRASVSASLYDYMDDIKADILYKEWEWGGLTIHPVPYDGVIHVNDRQYEFLKVFIEMYAKTDVLLNSYVTIETEYD